MDLRRVALSFLLFSMVFVLFTVSFGILPDPVCTFITLQLYNLPCVLVVFVLWVLSIYAFVEFIDKNLRAFYAASSVFFGLSLVISLTWVWWFPALAAVSFFGRHLWYWGHTPEELK